MATMAASMKGQTPELKRYLRSNKLPNIYEALLTGLAVMCPGDPLQFILDKLRCLKENGIDELNWDMFVEEHMRPPNKIITESNLDFIFNLDDESMIADAVHKLTYDTGSGCDPCTMYYYRNLLNARSVKGHVDNSIDLRHVYFYSIYIL
ncbi:dynein regulatory complex subunit 6-like [Ostrea edulis]|uniref:dynein regulatory complex subunit 6-like n=1 Tax=Ostrea edulis TaxID=37623 RepID=UPI0020940F54|nr:dynein regulatory complex subunit 6-like [Ostrea edulis]